MSKAKSSLFLLEMIIVIFFFSLASAVCLKLFTRAHTLARDTKELNAAVFYGENIGELFYEYGPDFEEETVGFFDDVPENYSIVLRPYADEDFLYLNYTYIYVPDDREIYTLSFKKHIKEVAE